ncbi:hypothetical protein B484DRAFT_391719 [Ochromonadaceae sp. CCMP2298]|nr:hypothetical protein B484DRAFT_391719 [Ochromonadaceae sp. CCMP2298]
MFTLCMGAAVVRLLFLIGDVGGRDACRDQLVQASFRKSFEQLDAESALLSVSEGEFLAFPSALEQLMQELRGKCEEAFKAKHTDAGNGLLA